MNVNSNMLYIDMPVQTGYSYTDIRNGTFNTVTKEFTPLDNANQTVVTKSDDIPGHNVKPVPEPYRKHHSPGRESDVADRSSVVSRVRAAQ